MRSRYLLALVPIMTLTACGRSALETRSFELRYLNSSDVEPLTRPFQLPDVSIAMRGNTVVVSGSHASVDRVARMITERDVPPPNARLTFQIIKADGSRAPDPAIAAVEAQLRQLFRFAGYQLVATGMTTGTAGAPVELRLEGAEGPFAIRGELERVEVVGDSGSVRLEVQLLGSRGAILRTRVSIGIGHTIVLGGQLSGNPGAIVLAVRPELVR